MKSVSKWIALLVAIVGVGFASTAHAQATRTWVSGVGDDVNPCSRTAPCKTFAGAISKTAAGGEINCLDPAGFGAVTLTKSITIDCTGTLGGVLASSTTGVIVNGAGAVVTLRGLELNGGPPNLPGVNGVRFLQGASLTIEDCTIYNFLGAAPNGFGVLVNNTSTEVRLTIINTTISNNGTATSGGGIGLIPTGTGAVRAVLTNVRIVRSNFAGINFTTTGTTGQSNLVVEGSTIANNVGVGIAASSTGQINLTVNNSVLSANSTGLVATGSNLQGRVGNTTISNNSTGVLIVGAAVVSSYGNNRLDGNGVDNAFSGLIPTK
jgi:hypothetical protein